MNFLDFLVQNGILDKKIADKIKNDLKSTDTNLDDELKKTKVDSKTLIKAKSDFYGLPAREIDDNNRPAIEILKYIPEESSLHYKIIPLGVAENFLEVGMVNPNDLQARDAINFIANKNDMPFKLFIISQKDFNDLFEMYKGLSSEVKQALGELENEFRKEDVVAEKDITKEGEEGTRIIEDAPVTKIVATILRYAVEGSASDVHIEPMRNQIRVRFRVDGVMNTSLVLPINVLQAVVARIKILSRMKLDEKRKPQDGRFSARIEDRKVDFRVSTFPSYYGEKVVMRILDQKLGVRSIEDLGLSERNMKLLREAIKKPYGMILISGPTGSGKSTTLYSVLKEVDSSKKNVLSLEDPVEYGIEGVNQSQVFPEIGYTFATGLRTTLRQDPDVIMVGEIRDSETAKLAIQASLTGHLVLSTIHTNTASGIVPRLIDMGVDSYLIPPTLVLGIAQRLVRKICPNSGRPEKIEGAMKEMIDRQFDDLPEQYKNQIPQADEILKIEPSDGCPMGVKGREAVFEMYKMDRDVEKAILNNSSETAIYDVVRQKGMLTMKEDAIIKAMNKQIPWEEVNNL